MTPPRPTTIGDYPKGDSLDWRDHIGLAYKMADKRRDVIERYGLEYDDVIGVLTVIIWYSLLPGHFDPSKGYRPSTYIMTALNRGFNAAIGDLLGYGTRYWNDRHGRTTSMDRRLNDDGGTMHLFIGEACQAESRVDDHDELHTLIERAELTPNQMTGICARAMGRSNRGMGLAFGLSHGTTGGWYRTGMDRLQAEVSA